MKSIFKVFLIAGLMTAVSLVGSISVMAADSGIKQAIDVTYNNYKTFINGVAYTAKNALGEPIEPFVYNGSIYVPMETLKEILKEDFTYDPILKYLISTTETQPASTAYLSDMQYSDFITGNTDDNSITWIDGINLFYTDMQGNTYDNGIVIITNYYTSTGIYSADDYIKGDLDNALAIVDYTLGGQYKNLSGTIVLPPKNYSGNETNEYAVDVLFYGDGDLLYRAKQVDRSRPHDFSIDISDIGTLSIKVVGLHTNDWTLNHTVLTDLKLSN